MVARAVSPTSAATSTMFAEATISQRSRSPDNPPLPSVRPAP